MINLEFFIITLLTSIILNTYLPIELSISNVKIFKKE